MSKIAFIFPGQGAQYVGMCQDFFDKYEIVRNIFEQASVASQLDVKKICFEPNEMINQTEYAQIAMLTTEVAILRVLESYGVSSDMCAGLSLGEYGALAAANVMSDSDLFAIIRKRGIYMQEAYPTGGAMTAVLGLDASVIEEVCQATPGIVTVANYNCPGQYVITGEASAVDMASQSLMSKGAKKCVPLKVSGPFHSKLLEDAGDKLALEIAKVNMSAPKIPYISNVTAKSVTVKEDVLSLLQRQVSSSVRWQQSVEEMLKLGIDTFVEIGPGKTLTGFMKRIDKEKKAKTYNIEKVEDLELFLTQMGLQ